MKIAIIGANGFIGKNLLIRLRQNKTLKIFQITRKTTNKNFLKIISKSDVIYHLAGVNRPKKRISFNIDNIKLTKKICEYLKKLNNKKKIIFTSSIQVNQKNQYGSSKKMSEKILTKFLHKSRLEVFILRLPNIFGKFCKPNYNSVVSTFCHNINRNKKVTLTKPNKKLRLLYIDDLINKMLALQKKKMVKNIEIIKFNNYSSVTLKKLSAYLYDFKIKRDNLFLPKLRNKFEKNLYSTFVTHIPKELNSYKIKNNVDHRGNFSELMKSNNQGQFSYFSIKPGKIRGHHYHESKVEKFFVIRGIAHFEMINLSNNKKTSFVLNGKYPKAVESVPGHMHKIKNIGKKEVIVFLWSNEIFNDNKPDTFQL